MLPAGVAGRGGSTPAFAPQDLWGCCPPPPQTDDLNLENRLLSFKEDVQKIVHTTHVKPNISTKQREIIKNIKSNTDIHLSIADKTSEFVVMNTKDHIQITKLHYDDPAYKKLEMPSTEKEITKFIASLTRTQENRINSK